jgi:hypothetical protein
MNTRTLFRPIILAFALLLASCTDIGTIVQPIPYSPTTDLRTIIPLSLGNTWAYHRTEYNDDSFDTSRIVDTIWRQDKRHFVFEGDPPLRMTYGGVYEESVDSNDYSIYFCRGCFQGSANSAGLADGNWLPIHLLKTPLAKGSSWRCADWDSLFGFDWGTITILNPDTTVQTHLGTVAHAIVLEQHTANWKLEFIIAPRVGIIRSSSAFSSLDCVMFQRSSNAYQ